MIGEVCQPLILSKIILLISLSVLECHHGTVAYPSISLSLGLLYLFLDILGVGVVDLLESTVTNKSDDLIVKILTFCLCLQFAEQLYLVPSQMDLEGSHLRIGC